MSLIQIKEQRAQAVADMRAIVDKAQAESRNLNTEETGRFDALKAKVTDLEQQEVRASFLDDAERRMGGIPVSGDPSYTDLEKRVSLVNVINAQLEGRQLTGAEAEYSKEAERRTGRKAEGVFVPMSLLETRVNTTTTASQIVPTEHRPDQFIEPLRNKLMARSLGARVLTGLSGNISIPKYGSGVTSGWVAENQALATSNMTFESKSLSPKHVGTLSEMSRQLLQQSSPGIEQLLRDDMAFEIARAIDSAMIKGGGINEPTGILATTGIQTGTLATLSYAAVLAMVEKLELVNAMGSAWLTSPQVATKLRGTLKSTTAGSQYLLENGRMADLPLYSTNQIPLADDDGQIILGDFSQILLGIWSELDILVNPYETTAYSRGGVLIRAMATVDLANRHPEAFVVANDVAV